MVAIRLPWSSAVSVPARPPPSVPRHGDDRLDQLSDIMIARSLCDALGHQTRDLLEAMLADYGEPISDLVFRVDGGISARCRW